jgi:hypothetical protein
MRMPMEVLIEALIEALSSLLAWFWPRKIDRLHSPSDGARQAAIGVDGSMAVCDYLVNRTSLDHSPGVQDASLWMPTS